MKKNLIYVTIGLLIFQLAHAQTNPALLTNFKIDGNTNTGYKISWNVANNEVVNKFDVERSTNGNDYTTITVISASQKNGTETYTCNEQNPPGTKVMYRLKMTSRGRETYYSNIVFLTIRPVYDEKINILGNPVKDKLMIRFYEHQNALDIKIYDMAGRIFSDLKVTKTERNDIVNIPLNMSMSPGIYVVEVNNGIEKLTSKFVKQ